MKPKRAAGGSRGGRVLGVCLLIWGYIFTLSSCLECVIKRSPFDGIGRLGLGHTDVYPNLCSVCARLWCKILDVLPRRYRGTGDAVACSKLYKQDSYLLLKRAWTTSVHRRSRSTPYAEKHMWCAVLALPYSGSVARAWRGHANLPCCVRRVKTRVSGAYCNVCVMKCSPVAYVRDALRVRQRSCLRLFILYPRYAKLTRGSFCRFRWGVELIDHTQKSLKAQRFRTHEVDAREP